MIEPIPEKTKVQLEQKIQSLNRSLRMMSNVLGQLRSYLSWRRANRFFKLSSHKKSVYDAFRLLTYCAQLAGLDLTTHLTQERIIIQESEKDYVKLIIKAIMGSYHAGDRTYHE